MALYHMSISSGQSYADRLLPMAAERQVSVAPGSRSEVRAKAARRRLETIVRPGLSLKDPAG
jgi:hypothetical protein